MTCAINYSVAVGPLLAEDRHTCYSCIGTWREVIIRDCVEELCDECVFGSPRVFASSCTTQNQNSSDNSSRKKSEHNVPSLTHYTKHIMPETCAYYSRLVNHQENTASTKNIRQVIHFIYLSSCQTRNSKHSQSNSISHKLIDVHEGITIARTMKT